MKIEMKRLLAAIAVLVGLLVPATVQANDLGYSDAGWSSTAPGESVTYAQVAKNGSANWIRVNVSWKAVNANGWGQVDAEVAAAVTAGATPIMLVYDSSPPQYTYPAGSNNSALCGIWDCVHDTTNPSYNTAWQNFVDSVVDRYPTRKVIVGNENNYTYLWGSCNSDCYASILRHAVWGINGRVQAICCNDYKGLNWIYNVQSQTANLSYAIGHHWYDPGEPNAQNQISQAKAERDAIAAHTTRAIWFTEAGVSASDGITNLEQYDALWGVFCQVKMQTMIVETISQRGGTDPWASNLGVWKDQAGNYLPAYGGLKEANATC